MTTNDVYDALEARLLGILPVKEVYWFDADEQTANIAGLVPKGKLGVFMGYVTDESNVQTGISGRGLPVVTLSVAIVHSIPQKRGLLKEHIRLLNDYMDIVLERLGPERSVSPQWYIAEGIKGIEIGLPAAFWGGAWVSRSIPVRASFERSLSS